MTETKTIELTRGKVAIIRAEDFERQLFCEFEDGEMFMGRICDRSWYAAIKRHTTYACAGKTLGGSLRELRMHRLIAGARATQVVDHRDGNGLNNLPSNLRLTDAMGNVRNQRPQRNHSTPFKGVAVHRETKRFEAYIRVNSVKRHLGLFRDPIIAARTYDAAALDAFGEFARLNFPEAQR